MYIELAYPEQQRTLDNTGKLTNAVIQYLVFEALDEAEALSYAFENVPKELDNLKLLSISISERKSQDIFLLEVTYGSSNNNSGGGSSDDNAEDEDAVFNFECSTGSAHITNAIKNIPLKAGKVDPGSFIGWNGKSGDDSEITGVEIMVPTLRESYTKQMRLNQLTIAFRRKVAALTGKINAKTFKGWDRGEVLFLGCSFSAPEKTAERVTVTFNFAIQLDEDNAEIEGIKFRKDGWTHVWAIASTTVEDGKTPRNKVDALYGSQVYQYADFGALGL